jgi:hypothetical protein
MIPLPALSAIPWKLVGYGVAIGALLLLGWRVHAWREGYLALPAAQEALQNEQSCGEGSECQKRAAALESQHRAATAVVVQEYTREIESLRSQPIPTRVIRVCKPAVDGGLRHASGASGTSEAPTGEPLQRTDEFDTRPLRELARAADEISAAYRALYGRDVALATKP